MSLNTPNLFTLILAAIIVIVSENFYPNVEAANTQFRPEDEVRQYCNRYGRYDPRDIFAYPIDLDNDRTGGQPARAQIQTGIQRIKDIRNDQHFATEFYTSWCPHCASIVMCYANLEQRRRWSKLIMERLFATQSDPNLATLRPAGTLSTLVQAHERTYCWRPGKWRRVVDDLSGGLILDGESCTGDEFLNIDDLIEKYRNYKVNIVPMLEWFRVQMFDYCRGRLDMRHQLDHDLNNISASKQALLIRFREILVNELTTIKHPNRIAGLNFGRAVGRLHSEQTGPHRHHKSREVIIDELEKACGKVERKVDVIPMYGSTYVQEYIYNLMNNRERTWFAISLLCKSLLDNVLTG